VGVSTQQLWVQMIALNSQPKREHMLVPDSLHTQNSLERMTKEGLMDFLLDGYLVNPLSVSLGMAQANLFYLRSK
jgi:hypothetical protein